jgi:hypothetical protein
MIFVIKLILKRKAPIFWGFMTGAMTLPPQPTEAEINPPEVTWQESLNQIAGL